MWVLKNCSEHQLVSLATVKAHLRLDFDAEDEMLTNFISSASSLVEQYIGLTIMQKVWVKRFDNSMRKEGVNGFEYVLPMGPVVEVESVRELRLNGERHTLRRYRVEQRGEKTIVVCDSKLPIEVIYKSGMALLPSEVPHNLAQAVLMLASHIYHSRNAIVDGDVQTKGLPSIVKILLQPYMPMRLC